MDTYINQIFLGIFLLANLIVGLRASRGVKTMDEYVLGNRSLGLGPLLATLFATLLMSSSIGIDTAAEEGILSLLYPIPFAVATFLLGWFIFPRITHFKKKYTVASMMQTMYGSYARIVTVLVSTVFSLLVIIGQLKAFGEIATFFSLSQTKCILIIGFIVTCYTALGGVRSVAATDVLQLGLVIISFILFFLLTVTASGGIMPILQSIPEDDEHLKFWTHPDFVTRIPIIFAWSVLPTFIISPPVVQRMLMTPKKSDIRNMFLGFSLLFCLLRILTLAMGLKLFVLEGNKHESMPLSDIIITLCAYPVGRLFFILGLCAIFMSTMDSYLNSLAILWSYDMIKPMVERKKRPFRMILWTKIITLVVGTASTLLSTGLKFTFYEIEGYACMLMSIIAIPFTMGLIGLKGNKSSFAIVSTTFLVSLSFPIFLYKLGVPFVREALNSLHNFLLGRVSENLTGSIFQIVEVNWVVAIPITLLVFFITHYVQHGRLIIIKRGTNMSSFATKKNVTSYFRWFTSPIQWSNDKASSYGINPNLFGVFIFVTSLIYYISFNTSLKFTILIITLKGCSVLLCSILLSRLIWNKKLLPYFNLFYLICVLFCVPFVSTLISLADPKGLFPVMNIVLHMVLLATLVDWQSFLLLQSIGSFFGICVYKLMTGFFLPSFNQEQIWFFVLSIGYTLTIILIFLRKKQLTQTQHSYKLSLDNAAHRQTIQTYQETQRQLTSILHEKSSMMTVIEDAITKLKEKGDIDKETKRIKQAVQYFQEQAGISNEWLLLKVASVDVRSYFKQVVEVLEQLGMDIDDDVVITNQSKTATLTGDQTYLVKLLVGGVMYLHHRTKEKVYVSIEDVALDYDVPDQAPSTIAGLRLVVSNEEKIPSAEAVYYPMRQQASLVDVSSLEMVGNLRIIQAHYGMMQMDGAQQWGQVYVIPTDLKALRPKIAYFAQEDLTEETSVDSEVDKAFLTAVRKKGMANLPLIKQALRTAKYYHKEQYRKSGEPFYEHPVAVATILLDYTDDATVIVAALLHDTVEDTPYTLRQLEATFGYDAAVIVDEVTHLHSKSGRAMKLNKKQSLQSLLEKENPKSLLVKLADRLHNMRTIGAKSKARQIAIAQETLLFFVPVAQRLKLQGIEEELKQLAAKVKGE